MATGLTAAGHGHVTAWVTHALVTRSWLAVAGLSAGGGSNPLALVIGVVVVIVVGGGGGGGV